MLKTTDKGFTYLPVTYQNCINWGGLSVCDFCNTPFINGYLVFVLNSCICPVCFHDWLERQQHYSEEDIAYDLNYQTECQDSWYKYHIEKGGDTDESTGMVN